MQETPNPHVAGDKGLDSEAPHFYPLTLNSGFLVSAVLYSIHTCLMFLSFQSRYFQVIITSNTTEPQTSRSSLTILRASVLCHLCSWPGTEWWFKRTTSERNVWKHFTSPNLNNFQVNEPELNLAPVKGQDCPEDSHGKKPKETCTYQSVEAHRATACSPVFMFCSISPSTSEDWMRSTIWLMTEDSLRIRPMTTHQSRHPASMKMCSKYLREQNRKFEAQKVLWCRKGRSSSAK